MVGYAADGTPARPYAGPGQYPGAGRTAELHIGIAGDDPENAASSLNVGAEKWNQTWSFRPTSVLQPVMQNPGHNGMAADTPRFADGTSMGTPNGSSPSSFQAAAMLRLRGLNSA